MAIRARAYSYIRFSSGEQIKGDSQRRQLDDSRKYALEHELELDEELTFRDLGVSGFKGRNVTEGELGAFITAVESGVVAKGSYLLVESLDRLSRESIVEALELFLKLLRLDITIVTFSDKREYNKAGITAAPMELMMSLSIFHRANDESKMKSQRVGAAWADKRKRAVASGHKMTSRCPAWLVLNKDTGVYEVIEEKADLVRRIYGMALQGIGQSSIERILNNEGLPSLAKSKTWYSSYIYKILNNAAVIGHYQPMKSVYDEGTSKSRRVNDGPAIEDYFPPIVEREVFLRVRHVRTANRPTVGAKGKSFTNVFNGIAKCLQCDSPLYYVNKGKPPKGQKYLVCSKAMRGLDCDYFSMRYDRVESLILGTLIEVDYSRMLPEQENSAKITIARLQDELAGTEAEAAANEIAITNLMDAIEITAGDSSAALIARLNGRESSKVQLKKRNERLTAELNVEVQVRDSAASSFSDFKDNYRGFRDVLDEPFISEDEIYLKRAKLNSQLKGIVEILSVGEWNNYDDEHVGMAEELHTDKRIDDAELDRLIRFFEQKGRLIFANLKLRAEKNYKGRSLLLNDVGDVLILNASAPEGKFALGPFGKKGLPEAEQAEEDRRMREIIGIPFDMSLFNVRLITDISFTSLDELSR